MGVQGLVTLLDTYGNGKIYRDVKFRKRRLVVDGCNLLYLMYFSSGLDQNHGGEYAAYEEHIEKFVAALRDCEITPYVVLDGGTDPSDKKLETVALRAESRLQKAHQAAADGRREHILPPLAKVVFRQTLARLKVPMAQCYGEADQEIAALASEWECPVLSNDSDFYIFNLPAGLLPISHFKWEAVEQSGSQRYIPCKSYSASSFCAAFDIKAELLPTFAALAGNDYVKLQRMESSISWAQFNSAGSKTSSRLEGLLCWMKGFQKSEEALVAALGLMDGLNRTRKAEVLQSLSLGLNEYTMPPSCLKRFFIHGTAPPFPAVDEEAAGLVPDWICLPLTQARVVGDILDVLQLHRMGLSIAVDHRDAPSANLTSRPLRRVMYGVLLGGGKQVNECDKVGSELKSVPVKAAFRGLVLSSLNEVARSERLQVLLDALNVTEAALNLLPPQLRLPVAVTRFWLQSARPPPDEELLKTLLLWLSDGDTLRHRHDLQAENQRCKQKLDLAVVHAFNQWQVCLKDSIYLNQVLGCPLPEPQVARLYEGTFVHQLVHMMRTGERLRNSDSGVMNQYRTMMSIVHTQKAPTSAGTQEKATAPRRRPLDDLTANLQQLFLLDEDEETPSEVKSVVRAQEELHLNDLVSVKTRYRTKERNNRCNNPEVARKEECRGRDIV